MGWSHTSANPQLPRAVGALGLARLPGERDKLPGGQTWDGDLDGGFPMAGREAQEEPSQGMRGGGDLLTFAGRGVRCHLVIDIVA